MGQAGSVEQRNAIRDVVSIKPNASSGNSAADKAAIVAALQAFCKMFPLEAATTAPLSTAATPTATDDPMGGVLDVKESKLFLVMHGLLQRATERTEKNSNEDLVRAFSHGCAFVGVD
jgi:hypothetical protein